MIPDAYFDRFDTAKYRNRNPVQRALIRRFVRELHELFLEAMPASRVLEIGVGEGFLSGYLSEKFPDKSFTGVDLREEDVARARRLFPRLRAVRGSIYDLSSLEGPFDLVMCCEVFEHLDEPDRALAEVRRLQPKVAIFTVPDEPRFMLANLARGKNVRRFGNDVEHVNHWNARTFQAFLERRFDVQRVTKAFPWVLALATPK